VRLTDGTEQVRKGTTAKLKGFVSRGPGSLDDAAHTVNNRPPGPLEKTQETPLEPTPETFLDSTARADSGGALEGDGLSQSGPSSSRLPKTAKKSRARRQERKRQGVSSSAAVGSGGEAP